MRHAPPANLCKPHTRTAVPSDPASSVLFLGRPSSRASSMSWSRPATSAGDEKCNSSCALFSASSEAAAGGKLSFTVDDGSARAVQAGGSSRPPTRGSASTTSALGWGGGSDSVRSVSSRQSTRFGVMHARWVLQVFACVAICPQLKCCAGLRHPRRHSRFRGIFCNSSSLFAQNQCAGMLLRLRSCQPR